MLAMLNLLRCIALTAILAASLLAVVECIPCAFHTIDLSGSWTLRNGNGSITLQSQLPGYVLQTLHAQNIVLNPLAKCV